MTLAIMSRDVREHWRALVAWSVVAAALIALQLSVYPTVRETASGLQKFIEQYPDVFKKIFRMQDYTSPAGYLGTELFSLMLPLVFIAIGAAWGASFTAEEEERGTADLLFALPVSRLRVMLAKTAAAAVGLVAVGLICYAALGFGVGRVDMNIAQERLLAGVATCCSLGLLFTALAALLGAAIGRKGVALGITVGLALVLFVFYSLAPLVDTFDAVLPYNPFQWTLGAEPLTRGFDAGSVWKPLAAAAVITAGAVAVFARRDLRQV